MTRKDGMSGLFTLLAVGVFLANHYAWNVPLVGDSNRWAIAAIGVLGIFGCAMGEARSADRFTAVLGVIGAAALVFIVIGLITGSQTMLTLLTIAMVALWIGSTIRHAVAGHTPAHVAHG